MAEQATSSPKAQAGKYLTFCLGSEEYGLEILKVQEIIGIMNITQIPKTPEFVRGVINLRGRVIPVTDLRLKFAMEPREDTEKTCIIVVQVRGAVTKLTIGIIVDEVSEVLDIQENEIEATPALGADSEEDFIMGMGKIEDKVVMLLDIDKALSSDDTGVSAAAAAQVQDEVGEGNTVRSTS